nr:ATP-dependent helicase NAM7-like [Quercus suber]
MVPVIILLYQVVVKKIIKALDFLKSLETLLCAVSVTDKGLLEKVFSENVGTGLGHLRELSIVKNECLRVLISLPQKFPVPDFEDEYEIKEFCLQYSCLIFCTVSSSAKLHEVMADLELLVIDEAAQLKECESTIPLQLPGIRHAILVGDEQQLPAMVKSKISEEAEFGRSLFERLVLLGHKKHLLNVQHRMHPSISLFPNKMFYENQILDGHNVIGRNYERHFLQGKMYGSYSFINVPHGKEEFNNSHSLKNMVEAAVVSEIVSSIFKESVRTKKKVRVGIISPYKAQVLAIGEKVKNYRADPNDDFSICVRSVDGFQGGEEDVIIISTVRCNQNGIVGFLKNHQRTNVALTHARHCLWILGNEATLTKRCTIWKELVIDAKKRRCFYNANEDKGLAQAITVALVECDQMHILFNMDSSLFEKARWRVSFSNDFLKSMSRVKDIETCKEVLTLLENLANGWRQSLRRKNLYVHNGTSSQLLEQYEVKGLLHLVWTVDILKENSYHIQILKFWDILPLDEIPKLANHLDVLFENYTVKKMNHCKYKCFDGCLVAPMRWPVNLSSCLDADPLLSLSEPLASLSLRDESESSSTTYRNNSKYTMGRSVVTNRWLRKLHNY